MIKNEIIDQLEIIIVNYNTADLIKKSLKRIYALYDNIQTTIIDGSDEEDKIIEVKKICDRYKNCIIKQVGYNIHHGNGLHKGITESNKKYIVTLDSDVFFKTRLFFSKSNKFIETCLQLVNDDVYCIGKVEHVNEEGLNVEKGIKYYHPRVCFINRKNYMTESENGIRFINHGAPAIKIMKFLHENNKYTNHDVEIKNDFIIKNRGTVKRYGYKTDDYNK